MLTTYSALALLTASTHSFDMAGSAWCTGAHNTKKFTLPYDDGTESIECCVDKRRSRLERRFALTWPNAQNSNNNSNSTSFVLLPSCAAKYNNAAQRVNGYASETMPLRPMETNVQRARKRTAALSAVHDMLHEGQ